VLNDTRISRLTKEQEKRLRAVYHALKEQDQRPFWRWRYNFSLDVTPERELLVYEALAEAYRAELRARHHPGRGQRRLLYEALFTAMNTAMSVDNVLAQRPDMKALPNLARAVEAFRAAWLKRLPAYSALPTPAETVEAFRAALLKRMPRQPEE
jgi:hypothetical protein